MITLLLHVLRVLPFLFGGYRQLAVENLALRQQLAVYSHRSRAARLRSDGRGPPWRTTPREPDGTPTPSRAARSARSAASSWRSAGARRSRQAPGGLAASGHPLSA